MIIALKIHEILYTEKRKKLTNFFLVMAYEYIHVNKKSMYVFMKIISILFSRNFIMTTKKSILQKVNF